MSYYRYRPDADTFAGIGVDSAIHDQVVDIHFQDRPLVPTWSPIAVHGFDDNPEEDGDFPSLSDFYTIPVLTQRAWVSLRPLIGYCCEALPIIHPSGEPHFIIHVMETIDCLDADRSEVIRFTDGRIMKVVRFSFRHKMLHGKHIFKLPLKSGGELIVDDRFRGAVEAGGLKGLLLKRIAVVE